MPKPTSQRPQLLSEWEQVLSAAAHLQALLPDAVLVGGTASAIHAHHRFSRDADPVLTDLRQRFDAVLDQLESVAGWTTARVQRPVQILGSLDGNETGVRQLIRDKPLETVVFNHLGSKITVPTVAEILRIKGILILKRNAARDYLDFAALATLLGGDGLAAALLPFDDLYGQPHGQSALQQLQVQLANPLPYDLDAMLPGLAEYKQLDARWHDWSAVKKACADAALVMFDRVSELRKVLPAEP